ncbi:hypothetical protein MWN41_03505 [Ornithobacterium rhinotracheale]|uniref:hypothetical protein n=1 Tax=Ornithobacterium rhinotracheale TaxID=28251 RepID=UPI001FF249FD|nr:hypothetical protein [Ornithobacterium rhinotracheale]MCK0202084.1 hypothetical protein [Ornithobacterium rhinotracheale]
MSLKKLKSTKSELIYEDKKSGATPFRLITEWYCNGYLIIEKPKLRNSMWRQFSSILKLKLATISQD